MADTEPAPSSSTEPLVPFFKKRAKKQSTTARIRDVSPTAGSSSGPSTSATSDVVLPTKKLQSSLFIQGTSGKKRRKGGGDDEDPESNPDGPGVNWSSRGSKARIEAGMELAAEEAEQIEEELRRKRRRDENDGFDPDEVTKDALSKDGKYHGQKGYQTLIRKKEEVPKAARVGPQRSTNTIRTVTLVDYQPDVCKDYKETGFCGFGDTCKFLHDRGTYLAGWQLDKLAEKASKQVPGNDDESSSEEEEDIPWACFICKKPYTDPIVTRCSHYFCSSCAIKRFAKTPKCAACGQPTGGMFNRADKVIKKMQEKQKAKEEADAEEADGVPDSPPTKGFSNDGDSGSESES